MSSDFVPFTLGVLFAALAASFIGQAEIMRLFATLRQVFLARDRKGLALSSPQVEASECLFLALLQDPFPRIMSRDDKETSNAQYNVEYPYRLPHHPRALFHCPPSVHPMYCVDSPPVHGLGKWTWLGREDTQNSITAHAVLFTCSRMTMNRD
jgi:hypothetical protein